ncbi:MAG: GTP-binding protein, partial [Lentisphaeria bacterium]|nr:GTP-binding protein [Lentisphaeria bacterium]
MNFAGVMMQKTPRGLRLQIGIFGKRNAGKSSLLNALTGQEVSIVSSTPGTTADPVEKPMELLPLGPVLLIDTAGLDDDAGELGGLRAEKSRRILERTDLALLVSDGSWSAFEDRLARDLRQRNIPFAAVFNKTDLHRPDSAVLEKLAAEKTATILFSARTGAGMDDLRRAILQLAPDDFMNSAAL